MPLRNRYIADMRDSSKKYFDSGVKGIKKDLMNPYKEPAMTATASVPQIPLVALKHCPLCDSPITRTQFVEIQSRIREEEQRKLEEHQRRLEEHKRKLDEQYRVKTEAFRIETQTKAKSEADARVLKITQERDAAVAQAKNVQEQTQEQTKKAVADAVTATRETLARDNEKKDLARAAEAARERTSLQQKIDALQRQLLNKSANELGDDAEIDLFEALRDAFPDDRITRIKKGEPGADIKHEVMYKGVVAGVILLDSKNRKAWQSSFATKLRKDQVDANAEHAILCTTAFPGGKKEFCLESGVILARPGRICDLVLLIRKQITDAHANGLANEKRAEKRDALYQYIASDGYRQKTAELNRLAGELLDLDASETQEHQRTWKKRGSLVRQLQRAQSAIETEISAIIEGKPA